MHGNLAARVGDFDLFFFSSRRRHTRYWRDWSSDVCSSDLGEPSGPAADARASVRRMPPPAARPGRPPRSEERRVGKECRARWAPCNDKKRSKIHEHQVRTTSKHEELTALDSDGTHSTARLS